VDALWDKKDAKRALDILDTGSFDLASRLNGKTALHYAAVDGHTSLPMIASAGDDSQVMIWDCDLLRRVRIFRADSQHVSKPLVELTGCRFLTHACSQQPDVYECAIATTGLDGATRIWDLRIPQELQRIDGDAPSTCLDCHSPSYALAIGYASGSVGCIDIRTWREVRRFDMGENCCPRSLALSPSGAQVAVGGVDGQLVLYGLQRNLDGDMSDMVKHHSDAIVDLAWGIAARGSPPFLACASLDRSWSCWGPRMVLEEARPHSSAG